MKVYEVRAKEQPERIRGAIFLNENSAYEALESFGGEGSIFEIEVMQ